MSDSDHQLGAPPPQPPPAPRRARAVANVKCAVCGHDRSRQVCHRAETVRLEVAEHLAAKYGDAWTGAGFICRGCLFAERADYLMSRLQQERGALSAVEADVARKAEAHATVAENIDREFQRTITAGQRVADSVARIGGSWTFLGGFFAFLLVWMGANAVLLRVRPFDPYPFILLNLILSCLAAVQAPIIMMSQNRLAARDRMQADQDFRVNLKAEIEVASLHEKVDHLLHAQWERMVELQQVQIELLSELAARKKAPPG
jgi:uncharacterized membrane protein